MDNTERTLRQNAMIADVYSRARAAAIATNDDSVSPEAEAKLAVKGFIRMMKVLDSAYWGWYNEDEL